MHVELAIIKCFHVKEINTVYNLFDQGFGLSHDLMTDRQAEQFNSIVRQLNVSIQYKM